MTFLSSTFAQLAASLRSQQGASRTVALARQERALRRRLAALRSTMDGQDLGLRAVKDYATFARFVPIRTQQDYEPIVSMLRHGQGNVIFGGKCTAYSRPADGSTDAFNVPVSKAQLHAQRRTVSQFFSHFARRFGSPLQARPVTSFARCSALTEVRSSTGWVARTEPYFGLGTLERFAPAKPTRRAGARTWLAATPREALKRYAASFERDNQEAYDRPEILIHNAADAAVFYPALRRRAGNNLRFVSVLASEVGLLAVQESFAEEGMTLVGLDDNFYEFIALDGAGNLPECPRAIPLGEVQQDVAYAVAVTSPTGLTRFITGDVVRFCSRDLGLVFLGRYENAVSAGGVRVFTRDLAQALMKACSLLDITLLDFAVRPARQTGYEAASHHEWVLTLECGNAAPNPYLAADRIDVALKNGCAAYGAARASGCLDLPEILFSHTAKDLASSES